MFSNRKETPSVGLGARRVTAVAQTRGIGRIREDTQGHDKAANQVHDDPGGPAWIAHWIQKVLRTSTHAVRSRTRSGGVVRCRFVFRTGRVISLTQNPAYSPPSTHLLYP
jgi:hypothetical protein